MNAALILAPALALLVGTGSIFVSIRHAYGERPEARGGALALRGGPLQ